MDDDKIIEMYLKRDENAIMLTAEKYGRKIYEVAYNVLYSREDAEECVNDTYLKVWNSIPPAKPREFFLPYLLRIVRNLAIDRYRKIKREKDHLEIVSLTDELSQLLGSEDNDINDSSVAGIDISDLLDDFLSSLKFEQRKIFILRYVFFYSVREIAEECNCSESKIKSLLSRTRKKLKIVLMKGGYIK